jgi:hypothetical protein
MGHRNAIEGILVADLDPGPDGADLVACLLQLAAAPGHTVDALEQILVFEIYGLHRRAAPLTKRQLSAILTAEL